MHVKCIQQCDFVIIKTFVLTKSFPSLHMWYNCCNSNKNFHSLLNISFNSSIFSNLHLSMCFQTLLYTKKIFFWFFHICRFIKFIYHFYCTIKNIMSRFLFDVIVTIMIMKMMHLQFFLSRSCNSIFIDGNLMVIICT